ncbi:MAG: hypothetical protein FWC15_07715 [Fibromonadales bacterium]|nr:hypothetical protein [Fibromonadales bacterium]
MGLLFPNLSEKNSKKVTFKHWLRVIILIFITCLLTWYGKVYEPMPMLTTVNEFAIWIFPDKNGLSALAVLPNDNIDTNNVKTGLRVWISPPDSLLTFERLSAVRYRGQNILVIGDSLSEQLRQDMLSTLDSTGNWFWLGPLSRELLGEDVQAELRFIDGNLRNYVFDLMYEGHKLRFLGSQLALDSTAQESVSLAIPMFKSELAIWNEEHIPETMTLVYYDKHKGFAAKKLWLKDWPYK